MAVGLVWMPGEAQAAAQAPLFVHRNGHLISEPFLDFYERHGGVESFGEPRTDAFAEASGLTVQYFDYARFEWHDEVILPDLGRQAAAEHANAAAFAWITAGSPLTEGRTYIPESGHTLGGAFGWFWQTHGEVTVLGYPISEEFEEQLPDGSRVLTQYFERAVLTYHPEHAGTGDDVRRLPLGLRFAPERATTPPPVVLAEARLAFRPGSGDGHNIEVAMERLHGRVLAPGARLSFLGAIGPITRENGYVGGSAIVGGNIVADAVGVGSAPSRPCSIGLRGRQGFLWRSAGDTASGSGCTPTGPGLRPPWTTPRWIWSFGTTRLSRSSLRRLWRVAALRFGSGACQMVGW